MVWQSKGISPFQRRALDFAYGRAARTKGPALPSASGPRRNLVLDAVEDFAEVLQLAVRLLRTQRGEAASHEEAALQDLPRRRASPMSSSSVGTRADGGTPAGAGGGPEATGSGGPDGGPGTGPADGGQGTGPADGGPGAGPADGGQGTGPADGGTGSGPGDGGTGTLPADAGPGTIDGAGPADAGTVREIAPAAQELVTRHEGCRTATYNDTQGHPTVGVGVNLDRPSARDDLTAVGADYNAVRAGQAQLTDDQVEQLFQQDLNRAVGDGERLIPNFNTLPHNVQLVVVDMIFNMGAPTFQGFRNMIDAVQTGDYQRAATEMQDSRWYQQTGARAVEDVRLMRYQEQDGGTP